MDWIKVKVKHAEYDFEGAPDHVFRAWIKLMTFVAFIERMPTQAQIEARIGKENYNDLESHLLSNGYTTRHVMEKVLEDVKQTNIMRRKSKERQERYREAHGNAPHNPSHNTLSNASDKIRVDKRRISNFKLDTNNDTRHDPKVVDGLHEAVKNLKT